jgi:hypothetical protein
MPEEPQGQDQRRSPRLSPKTATRLEAYRDPTGKGPDIALKALDISANGAKLVLREKVEAGQILGIALYGPHLMPVAGSARVIWCKGGEEGAWTVGIEFLTQAGPDNIAALARP